MNNKFEAICLCLAVIGLIYALWELEDAKIASNKARMMFLNSQIEYLRLKTAMAVIGLDDVRETDDGHAEFIWSKKP